MKFSTVVSVLAASADTSEQKKDVERNMGNLLPASFYSDECSHQIEASGGSFSTINNGFDGRVNLGDFRGYNGCTHTVQADNRCEEIEISYRRVAVECNYNHFGFAWKNQANELISTPRRCDCFSVVSCWTSPHQPMFYSHVVPSLGEQRLGPTDFNLNSNSFTFFFHSVGGADVGHVVFDWYCVKNATTTSTSTTTSTTTSTSTTLTTTSTTISTTSSSPTDDESCSEHHNGYEEFANQVRSGIERALNNDIQDFSRRPGTVTRAAGYRKNQFERWFVNIFGAWYQDVTEASDSGSRKCLTDNFPYDSPGNLNKENVYKLLV